MSQKVEHFRADPCVFVEWYNQDSTRKTNPGILLKRNMYSRAINFILIDECRCNISLGDQRLPVSLSSPVKWRCLGIFFNFFYVWLTSVKPEDEAINRNGKREFHADPTKNEVSS